MVMFRVAVAAAGAILLWITLWWMSRLSWEMNVVIALVASLAFAFYFERDEPQR